MLVSFFHLGEIVVLCRPSLRRVVNKSNASEGLVAMQLGGQTHAIPVSAQRKRLGNPPCKVRAEDGYIFFKMAVSHEWCNLFQNSRYASR
jgi:hypothetical protein